MTTLQPADWPTMETRDWCHHHKIWWGEYN